MATENLLKRLKYSTITLYFVLGSCATEPVSSPADSVLLPYPPHAHSKSVSPVPSTLKQSLDRLGIEGIGLEYEPPESLSLIERVFRDSRCEGHRIRTLYTGMSLEYDAKNETLTIGGTADVDAILKFISKIPLR